MIPRLLACDDYSASGGLLRLPGAARRRAHAKQSLAPCVDLHCNGRHGGGGGNGETGWRDPEFGHRLPASRTRTRIADRPLVLILGTSRAQNAFDPSAMGFGDEPGVPRAFNYGQSAAPPLKCC